MGRTYWRWIEIRIIHTHALRFYQALYHSKAIRGCFYLTAFRANKMINWLIESLLWIKQQVLSIIFSIIINIYKRLQEETAFSQSESLLLNDAVDSRSFLSSVGTLFQACGAATEKALVVDTSTFPRLRGTLRCRDVTLVVTTVLGYQLQAPPRQQVCHVVWRLSEHCGEASIQAGTGPAYK